MFYQHNKRLTLCFALSLRTIACYSSKYSKPPLDQVSYHVYSCKSQDNDTRQEFASVNDITDTAHMYAAYLSLRSKFSLRS